MREEQARLVTPIVRCALDLQEEWTNARGLTLEAGRIQLREKFLELSRYAAQPQTTNTTDTKYLGVAYPLACWIDELFTRLPHTANWWTEQKFEAEFFGTNDRAWLFWKQAEIAGRLPTDDDLEVFYICAGLGFRGERIEEPIAYAAWASTTRDRLLANRKPSWVPPPSLDPPSDVPQLVGKQRARNMALNAGIFALIVIPVAAWFVVRTLAK